MTMVENYSVDVYDDLFNLIENVDDFEFLIHDNININTNVNVSTNVNMESNNLITWNYNTNEDYTRTNTSITMITTSSSSSSDYGIDHHSNTDNLSTLDSIEENLSYDDDNNDNNDNNDSAGGHDHDHHDLHVTTPSTRKQNRITAKQLQQSHRQTTVYNFPSLVFPLKSSNLFCLGLEQAINNGDPFQIADVFQTFTHPQIVFKQKDDWNSFHTRGQDKVIEYFQSLLTVFPDGIMFVKRITPSIENGVKIVRSKIYFNGTKLITSKENPQIKNGTIISKSVCMKGYATAYLDRYNRIVVFSDELFTMRNVAKRKNTTTTK